MEKRPKHFPWMGADLGSPYWQGLLLGLCPLLNDTAGIHHRQWGARDLRGLGTEGREVSKTLGV